MNSALSEMAYFCWWSSTTDPDQSDVETGQAEEGNNSKDSQVLKHRYPESSLGCVKSIDFPLPFFDSHLPFEIASQPWRNWCSLVKCDSAFLNRYQPGNISLLLACDLSDLISKSSVRFGSGGRSWKVGVNANQPVSAAEMERMMKVQEVILKAISGSLRWWEATEIIGVSDRTMGRWWERCREEGYDGLYDRLKGMPSPERVPLEQVERVLQLYREGYFDFNVRHFHEKLAEEHGVTLSYTLVKLVLEGAGLVRKRRRRGKPKGSISVL